MHACMHVCMCMYVVRTHARTHARRTHAHMHVHTHAGTYACNTTVWKAFEHDDLGATLILPQSFLENGINPDGGIPTSYISILAVEM